MSNEIKDIRVIGPEIWFNGYLVGSISDNLPATTRDEFAEVLSSLENEDLIRDAYDEGYGDAQSEAEEFQDSLEEEIDHLENELDRVSQKVVELEIEIDRLDSEGKFKAEQAYEQGVAMGRRIGS